MSALPKAGDLAMIVRVCGCPSTQSLRGVIVRVTKVFGRRRGRCACCGHKFVARAAEIDGDRLEGHYLLEWLVRIKPLDELEGVEHREEVPA